MSSVIDLRTYVGASNSRLLVMVDLQQKNYDALAREHGSGLSRALDNCMAAIRHARNFGIPPGAVNSTNFLNQWGTDGGNRRIWLAARYTF